MSRLDETRLENVHQRDDESFVDVRRALRRDTITPATICLSTLMADSVAFNSPATKASNIVNASSRWSVFLIKSRPSRRRYETLEQAIADQELKLKMKATRRDHYNHRFVVVRFDSENGEKEFRPFYLSNDGWIVKDPPGKLPLFDLEELRKRPDERVYSSKGKSARANYAIKSACLLSHRRTAQNLCIKPIGRRWPGAKS